MLPAGPVDVLVWAQGRVRTEGNFAAHLSGGDMAAGGARRHLPGGVALLVLGRLHRGRHLHVRHRKDHEQDQSDRHVVLRTRRTREDRGARMERHRGQLDSDGAGLVCTRDLALVHRDLLQRLPSRRARPGYHCGLGRL